MTVPGFTSTGSKRPDALFGAGDLGDLPTRMERSSGCRLWDTEGREYLDYVMALGAVTLGYGQADVAEAAWDAIGRGGVGSLAPAEEERLAARLGALLPWVEQVRFLKTGAEAVAAAVRIGRAATGRGRVLGCGYHGWLDLASTELGVPKAVSALYGLVPFNDCDGTTRSIREVGNELALVIVEPVVDGPPSLEWLRLLRTETERVGALLVFDEIKTGFRLAVGGAAERFGVWPDLVVYGKALGNGFPLAAVGGSRRFMDVVTRTWISSTLATEFVALAAAHAAVDATVRLRVPEHLGLVGGAFYAGLGAVAARFPRLVTGVAGVPEMCHLRFRDEGVGARVARGAARRGVLFKRTGYNFVSLAHSPADNERCLAVVSEVLSELDSEC